MLTTVVKTGQVLELFTRERPEWGVTEIARALHMPKSNVHDIVRTLVAINLLNRTGQSRYRLGWRLVGLASGVTLADGLRRCAPGVMAQLAGETGQTAHLAVWDGERLMFLARQLGKHGFDQPHASAGSRLPAHCTASGKVLLSDLPWAEVVERIGVNDSDQLDFRTSRSLRDVTRLRAELEQVRSAGIGYNRGETDKGVAGLAAPVRDAEGRAVAALGISVTMDGFESFRERYEPLLKRMADTLGRSLVELEGRQRTEWAASAAAVAGPAVTAIAGVARPVRGAV